MYEMKGALSGYAAPARPVALPSRSSSAGFPASPFQLGCLPASPFRLGRFPSLTVSSSAGSRLAGPGRPVARPPRRHAPPAGAKHPRQIPVSRPFPRPGEAPGWCPFPAVKAFLRPLRPSRKSRRGIHFEFFPRPHVVHRIPSVIRMSQRLSTALCTTTPQITRRNSENTSARSPYVIIRSFLSDIRVMS
jgi:hypothetical protein